MYLMVLAGFVCLLGGADILVRGAVALAQRLNISPLIIGMTVIAFGTSAPEFLVSLRAAMADASAMAIGNVVGSNVANILLILGAAALVSPIKLKRFAMVRDGMILLVGSLLFSWFCWTGEIDFMKGGVLLVLFLAFMLTTYIRESRNIKSGATADEGELEDFKGLEKSLWLTWMALIAGLAGVLFGSELLVDGGISVARHHGVSEEVIGLTILAIGTSLPELAASVMAAFRGHADVALGNVVGSNLFNMLAVVGGVAVILPLGVPEQIQNFDLWLMLAMTVLLLPFILLGWRLTRPVASLFLILYTGYVAIQTIGVSEVFG